MYKRIEVATTAKAAETTLENKYLRKENMTIDHYSFMLLSVLLAKHATDGLVGAQLNQES